MLSKQFVGFLFAGGTATALNYIVFLLLLSNSFQYLFAAAIGYLSGISVSYIINKVIVFRSEGPRAFGLIRYAIIYVLAMLSQLAVLQLLVLAGVQVELANLIAIGVVVFINFFVIRRFVFRPRDPVPSRDADGRSRN